MRSKGDTAAHLGHGIGNDSPPITPVSSQASESEEWTWMVAEDPAFYLSKPGRAESTGV
ncbi:MAG: hypothetical protein M3Q62_05885 [Actinomycetota bacterium]|nr:hypothetical protein [Rubrobacteraceae bacterium]MBA3702022.1 hypothetical protein [Rubrobacteraceae bacterium]MDQ3183063.1 hypothetical protein [Actinomycetota bacterium]